MKHLLFAFSIVLLNFKDVKSQDFALARAPEKGDFICISSEDSAAYNFIFKKSCRVYYNYSLVNKNKKYRRKHEEERITELFNTADKIAFEKIKSADENKIFSEDRINYRFMKYNKGGKTYNITWNTKGEDNDTAALNSLVLLMTSFW